MVNTAQTASFHQTLQFMETPRSEPAMTSIANMTPQLELEFVSRTPNLEQFTKNAKLVADALQKHAVPTLTATLNFVVPTDCASFAPQAVNARTPHMFALTELVACRAATTTPNATLDSATPLLKTAPCLTNAPCAHQAVMKSLLLGKMLNSALFPQTTSETLRTLLQFATKTPVFAHLSWKTNQKVCPEVQ